MTQVLEMQFTTAAGKTSTITVDVPKENLTSSEVQGVMQTIIDQNVFEIEAAAFVAIKGARIVERQVESFDVSTNA
ncbi:MAG: DUF2922 domain-containing protein [Lysinibacillus sp.]